MQKNCLFVLSRPMEIGLLNGAGLMISKFMLIRRCQNCGHAFKLRQLVREPVSCESCGTNYLISKTYKGITGIGVMWGSIVAFSYGFVWGILFIFLSLALWLHYLKLTPCPEE
jgi:uncharacterized protein (DUF983 family)